MLSSFLFLSLICLRQKRRPAVVVAVLEGSDIILCPVTSQKKKDAYVVPLDHDDFESGVLTKKSFVRPNCMFTADRQLILYKMGKLKPGKIGTIVKRIINILEA